MHGNPTRTEIERCYRMLELELDAPSHHVERSWRKLVDEWQPDRFVNDPVLFRRAHTRVQDLNHARQFLTQHHVGGVAAPEIRNSKSPRSRSRVSWHRRPLLAPTLFAGVAVFAVLIGRPLTMGKNQVASEPPPAPVTQNATPVEPLAEPVPAEPTEPPKMVLMAKAPLTVGVTLVADGRILLPPTALQAGESASVPRLGPTYVKYSAGQNLEIQIDGRRYPMPDVGPSRAKIN